MKTILAKLSGKWLSCGSYGVYVAVTGSLWLVAGLQGLGPAPFSESALLLQDIIYVKV